MENFNTKSKIKKDKWVQIRVNEETKEKIEELAWLKRITVSKLMLDSVLIIGAEGKNQENIKVLVEGLIEFNKILKFNEGHIRFPEDIDKDKLMEAIRLSQMMI